MRTSILLVLMVVALCAGSTVLGASSRLRVLQGQSPSYDPRKDPGDSVVEHPAPFENIVRTEPKQDKIVMIPSPALDAGHIPVDGESLVRRKPGENMDELITSEPNKGLSADGEIPALVSSDSEYANPADLKEASSAPPKVGGAPTSATKPAEKAPEPEAEILEDASPEPPPAPYVFNPTLPKDEATARAEFAELVQEVSDLEEMTSELPAKRNRLFLLARAIVDATEPSKKATPAPAPTPAPAANKKAYFFVETDSDAELEDEPEDRSFVESEQPQPEGLTTADVVQERNDNTAEAADKKQEIADAQEEARDIQEERADAALTMTTPTGTVLKKPAIRPGIIGLPEPVTPAPVNNLPNCPNPAPVVAPATTALLETDSETETDTESDMEASLGLDTDADDELFMELDSEADDSSDSESDVIMHMDTEADESITGEADLDSTVDADAGSVVVHEESVDHSQDADPIVTEQMETEQAMHDFGFLEADADADADMDAEAELEAESDMDADIDLLESEE